MTNHNAIDWIDGQQTEALKLLKSWVEINSYSGNINGLLRIAETLKKAFAPLCDTSEEIPLSNGSTALLFRKRPEAKQRILLGGHMDTVYPIESPFQYSREENGRMMGPGAADMKGGLMVLLLGVQAHERFLKQHLYGWDILITPDEELGSPYSRNLWIKSGKQAEFALLFEPSFHDGAFVDERKGAINYHLEIKGRAAHAGRDFVKGRSAIRAISTFIHEAHLMADTYRDLSFNAGHLIADSPLNVVAESAHSGLNMRSFHKGDLEELNHRLQALAKEVSKKTETEVILQETSLKMPKLLTEEVKNLFDRLSQAAIQLNMPLKRRASGGLSDGNILAEAGVPTLDTLGVVGGELHTPNEYMEIPSMVERAKLLYLYLESTVLNA